MWRRAAQTIIKKFYKRNFSILIFFFCGSDVGMRRRPVALFTLETSNRRNVFARFRYVSSIRLFDYTSNRRQSVSAAKRFGGKAFRRQRFSPFRLHVVIGSGRLCGATRDSADRRPTLDAETPKSEKTGENRRDAEKRENRRKSPKRRKDRDAWKMF